MMSVMAPQITSVLIVCSTGFSGRYQRKHQSSVSLAFVKEIHQWQVASNSPHKGPVMQKMFTFDDVIMVHPTYSIPWLLMSWRCKEQPVIQEYAGFSTRTYLALNVCTGENLDAVTAVTDSFKMADVFAGDRTGGAVAQTSAQTICVSVWQGRMWVSWLQWMHGSSWLVVVNAKSAIVDPRDAAVTARGWCSISFVKPNNDTVTTKIPTQRQHHTL